MKGINFLPWKIKAIADSPLDKAWQTRRVIKPQPEYHGNEWWSHQGKGVTTSFRTGENTPEMAALARYLPAEIVYIKEAWWTTEPTDGDVYYKLDWGNEKSAAMWNENGQWKFPRNMPAWAARYFIRITDVRAERTKDISFEDCLAEGIVGTKEWCELSERGNYKPPEPLNPDDNSNEAIDQEIDRGWTEYARQAYFRLYDSINGKGAHELNWDWVYSFVRCERESK